MKPVTLGELEVVKAQLDRLRKVRGPVLLALAFAVVGLPLMPFDFPLPGTNYVMSSLVAVIVGIVIIILAAGASRGKNGSKGMISPVAGAMVAAVGFIFILAAIATLPPSTTGPAVVGSGPAMTMTLLPSIDTTASYPAGSYTACTSHTFSGAIGGDTGVGVVWTTSTGKLQSQTSAVFLDTVNTAKSNKPGNFRTANCFQVAFALTYQGVPVASGGSGISEPIYVQIASMTYSYLRTNNSTGSTWYSLAPFSAVGGTLPASGFPWIAVGTNSGGAASSSFKIVVDTSSLGPWGYSATADYNSFAGATWSITFNIGLPAQFTSASLGNAYATPVPFTLVDQHQ